VFKIVTTSFFLQRLRKFLKKHPELRERFTQVADGLIADLFNPRMKYHQLSGKLQGLQAVSITDSYRLVLTVIISDQEIILLDIDSPDEVYR
jgi:mRNA-degrading endonuclease YafQ of YafQ-DinJ toxin-antitoxin module